MMIAKKFHIKKKKWAAYLALGILSMFLISTFKAEIGSIFHTASHILTGSDYSHTHQQEESLNRDAQEVNYAFDSHKHELLAFLRLLEHPENTTMHTAKNQILKLGLPSESGLAFSSSTVWPESTKILPKSKHSPSSTLIGEIPTPPPKV